MSKLAYITHPIYLQHNTGPFHPENAKRLIAIEEHLANNGFFKKISRLKPDAADESFIAEAQDTAYVQAVKEAIANGQTLLDQGDTVVCKHSFEAALFSVGGGIKGIDLLKSNEFTKIFCAVRPPGHHAEYDYARGFCIFNNVAIAVKYAQQIGLAKKILIVDWDVHHGNGTQHVFEKDDSVFYYSIHQYPFFPGSGAEYETGLEKGKGYTLNHPMRGGSTDSDYLAAFEVDLKIIEKKFIPDLIVISAGFDAHRDDPLAGILLTENVFAQMTEMVNKLAWKYCGGKLLSILEGGYHLKALAHCVEKHLEVLLKH